MSWTSDGMLLALGLFDGNITLRDKAGNEKLHFSASSSPVWSLTWSPGVSCSNCRNSKAVTCSSSHCSHYQGCREQMNTPAVGRGIASLRPHFLQLLRATAPWSVPAAQCLPVTVHQLRHFFHNLHSCRRTKLRWRLGA
eukprot:GHUV01056640.1.p1 GENE.GHUV01056640.1~~GHUV01056640.1.p1  ORF type:complete len:139 (-),score=33.35 GHUV01056640.1:60-476(-)